MDKILFVNKGINMAKRKYSDYIKFVHNRGCSLAIGDHVTINNFYSGKNSFKNDIIRIVTHISKSICGWKITACDNNFTNIICLNEDWLIKVDD